MEQRPGQTTSPAGKGYPVGSLLFWKTDKPPDLKNLPVVPEKWDY
jgi:hypothetical protein